MSQGTNLPFFDGADGRVSGSGAAMKASNVKTVLNGRNETSFPTRQGHSLMELCALLA